ncbi:MAG: hypothetical protein E7553_02260 [Ruminococcaceae bacterium]|nr:hypothetical protein [Oscillospiraceae bacterium]
MLSNELLLLKIIGSGGRISLLRNRGLSLSQIAMLIQEQQEKGNVVVLDSEINLTAQGLHLLEENISKVMPRKKDRWILPQEHLYKEPISSSEIILPKKRKI